MGEWVEQETVEVEVVNWERYNPRSDRANHTWFRMENSIATEPKFHGLSAAQRFAAVCIFAEVSKSGGKAAKIFIPWLSDQLKIKRGEILDTIQALVFRGVLRLPNAVKPTPPDTSLPTTDERTNGQTNETNDTLSGAGALAAAPLPALGRLWNELVGESLPQIRECKGNRRKMAEARLRERDLAAWRGIVGRILASPFCLGDNSRGWRADFDFLIRPDTAQKVLEGKYDPRDQPLKLPPKKSAFEEQYERELAEAKARGEVVPGA